MLFWILAVLALYLVQTFGVALMYLPKIGISGHVGPRDNLPEKTGATGRAQRALINMKENLPLFLTFAILSFIITGTDQALAEKGAMVFLVGRIAYLPAYLWGVPWIRSIMFGVSYVGLAMMLVAII